MIKRPKKPTELKYIKKQVSQNVDEDSFEENSDRSHEVGEKKEEKWINTAKPVKVKKIMIKNNTMNKKAPVMSKIKNIKINLL